LIAVDYTAITAAIALCFGVALPALLAMLETRLPITIRCARSTAARPSRSGLADQKKAQPMRGTRAHGRTSESVEYNEPAAPEAEARRELPEALSRNEVLLFGECKTDDSAGIG
jgi:hypothetical protein